MIYRHLATKGYDWGLVSKSLILDNFSVYTRLDRRYGKVDRDDYADEVIKAFPDNVSLSINLRPIKELISHNEALARLLIKDSEVSSLNSIFSDEDAMTILTNDKTDSQLRKVASEMFSGINPLTNAKDVLKSERYASCIPIVTLTGTLPPQLDENDNSYFNPNGCVTIAEFLDSLNAIKFGSNSNISRGKSLDNVSDERDFFNEGYKSCLEGYSSPFYDLYTRIELLSPITRVELAYITVICWSQFRKKFGTVFSGKRHIGINIDWKNVKDIVNDFEDGKDYYITILDIGDDEEKAPSINLKDYLRDKDMTSFKERMRDGIAGIPMPMFMSLLELDYLGVFHFEDLRLDPLKEVSRGELAYFLVRLANVFKGEL